jgi:hypothetical protein
MQVVCEPNGSYYVLNDDDERVAGPFDNEDDAWDALDNLVEE